MPKGLCQAVVFDLDGTLLDTLRDIANAANDVLLSLGQPIHPIERYRFLVGDGVKVLFQRAYEATIHSDDLSEKCVEAFRGYYAKRWKETSGPYPGIAPLLDDLTRRGIPISVLSNKPHPFTVQCVDAFLGRWPWASVVGQSDLIPPKPDPTGLNSIVDKLGVNAERVLYVGDTNTDMKTAIAGGCFPLGVTWGFRERSELLASGAQAIIDHPAEVLEWIQAE